MTVTVWIPPLLRRHTAGRELVPATGRTAVEVLEGLGAAGSEALALLVPGRTVDSPLATLFVNGAPLGQGALKTPLTAGDELAIVPAVGGGG